MMMMMMMMMMMETGLSFYDLFLVVFDIGIENEVIPNLTIKLQGQEADMDKQ
eukprot:CAMPEP_0114339926 /NCGR_PEP_ID=MMETSP0101-20121206/8041_1 /TAXON_ID=38822 ORGANISM="Pteridomonas danica, Strain PT" /NCGR_SAMPLE_ID=MMETSP0101 /ASSEMBLY_ACC=CAM_ASM_000211 /LENGTH=51 /DNA_ID=CAMNT_0001473029 /DNA_START=190 /DNA_END=345 /DNA_ORIENTATION=+